MTRAQERQSHATSVLATASRHGMLGGCTSGGPKRETPLRSKPSTRLSSRPIRTSRSTQRASRPWSDDPTNHLLVVEARGAVCGSALHQAHAAELQRPERGPRVLHPHGLRWRTQARVRQVPEQARVTSCREFVDAPRRGRLQPGRWLLCQLGTADAVRARARRNRFAFACPSRLRRSDVEGLVVERPLARQRESAGGCAGAA